ncbi:hypothetical protein [Herbiconiux sp. L3-i23]|uniref:hypothetical protein n=1 Tax=Herbiconiux sp. L3-i23 TaxID=2905871 RepID=UPI00204D1128|nr:hypothetical protein [Herbiconiux sp. L3-i23]BDI23806.1 hypothetical protein L3i23_25820 [Herbiconiux sp. L3-i23]
MTPPPPPVWREPTLRLPLRWGGYRSRLVAGGILLAVGALLIVQTTAYTTTLGWLGAVVHFSGWVILPARGGRRSIAAPASLLSFVLMLIGPPLVWLTAIPLALWLLVRERPGITYVLVPLPALCTAVALVLFGAFVPKLGLFIGVFAVAVLCAWAARSIALRERSSSEPVS